MLSSAARRVALQSRNWVRPAASTTAWRKLSSAAVVSDSSEAKSPGQLVDQFEETDIRMELGKLRDAEAELMSQINAPEVEIKWDDFKGSVKYPGLVDELKKEYESAENPNIDQDVKTVEKEINSLFDPIITQYEKFAAEAEADTEDIEKQLEQFNFVRDNIKDLPLDEFFERYPKIKEAIEEDIANNKWFID